MNWRQTLISSGASSVASLALTGATSSIVIDGRLDTTLTSGTCCRQKATWMYWPAICLNYQLTFTIYFFTIFVQLLYLHTTCVRWWHEIIFCACESWWKIHSHFYIFQKKSSTSIFSAYLATFSQCCQAKLTGLGVKWKLERASNFRKSVSISFWISTWAGFSFSYVFCWNKKNIIQ